MRNFKRRVYLPGTVEVKNRVVSLINSISLRPDVLVALGALLVVAASAAGRAEDLSSTQIQALVHQGKLDDALSATDAELERDGSSVTYRFVKGSILTRMNRLDEAAAIFQALTEEHPELPEPYNNLAVVYAAQGDFEKARQALQKAINTHPSYATAHENLGDIYAKMASQAYNHALQLDQDNSSAKAKLSLITDLFSVPQPAHPAVAQAAHVAAQPPAVPAATAPQSTPAGPAGGQAPETKVVSAAPPVVSAAAPAADNEAVRRTVEMWATAWSSKDADAYLASYADDFSMQEGQSRSRWAEGRKARLAAPRFIKVGVVNLEVVMLGDDHAQATFLQDYQSDAFSDRIRKALLLKKVGDRWLITQETIR